MEQQVVREYIYGKKNFVFLGEAGSGKTEVSINIALAMAKLSNRPVHYFDMDQTKPLFRARDAVETLAKAGITLHFQDQILDSPTVATGVIEALSDPEPYVIMDVGGGANGSHMIGQFAKVLALTDADILYLFDPYRPWSGNKDDIGETMRRVLNTARLSKINLVGNPNYGVRTKPEDIVEGMRIIHEMFPQTPVSFVAVLARLCDEVIGQIQEPLLPIELFTLPPWMLK